MWIYYKGVYVSDAQTRISEQVYDILQNEYKKSLFTDILEKIKAQTYIEQNIFFEENKKEWQCVKNGLLNINTLELKEFTPNERFFTKIPVEYNPNAKCPNINKHLKTVLANEKDINLIKELGGFCLEREYRLENAFMLCGYGRNGKGKTIELIKRKADIKQ